MIIKTWIEKRDEIEDREYIDKPVTDYMNMLIDVRKGTMEDNSKVIGVITNAVTIGNEVEITIALRTRASKLQGEWLIGATGEIEPVAFSMALK